MNLGEEPIAGKDRHPLLEQLKEAYSEKDDPNVVRTYLVGHGYVEDEVVAVIDCIKRHYDYTEEGKPTKIEGQVVQDADIMDMLGPIGVARAFLSAGARGSSLGEAT